MVTWKKGTLLRGLVDLHQKRLKAEQAYSDFIKENAPGILRELDEARQEHWQETESFLPEVGIETGIGSNSRHVRRILSVLKALELNYLTEPELAKALDQGISLSAIGQLVEGKILPKRVDFRRWMKQLGERGMTTKIRKSRGK